MRALVQRVTEARVRVDAEVVGEIGRGLVALIGVTHDDEAGTVDRLADKLANLRIFSDADDKMNLSVLDVGGAILVVSQFTLYGDARKGRRPAFVDAARPEVAEPLIDRLCDQLEERGVDVATGRFRTEMQVELINDGPVTLMVEL